MRKTEKNGRGGDRCENEKGKRKRKKRRMDAERIYIYVIRKYGARKVEG